jgi:N-methylhydantoinase A
MSFRVGIDTGGTFTDAVAVDDTGSVLQAKSLTTPQDLKTGIINCLGELARGLDLDLKGLLDKVTVIVHGTTEGDNTISARSGPRIGIIATKGHKDTVQLRRVRKEGMWDWRMPFPQPLAPRWLRVGVKERVDSKGEVLIPLDEDGVRQAIAYLKRMKVTSIVVTLLFSFLNPSHERKIREIIKQEYPEALVTLSHEVLSAAGEYERFTTATIDAYIRPVMAEYINSLEKILKGKGFKGQLFFMQNNGGCVTAAVALQKPSTLVIAGPVAGPSASLMAGGLHKAKNLLSLDMGGTGFAISLVENGRFMVKNENIISNHRFSLPVVEVENLGTGGGSQVWFDLGDTIHVGPQSAGADPGPACYGKGGNEATFTDAAVVLGYLNPEGFLVGQRKLKKDLAEEAIKEKVTPRLGLDVPRSAATIYKVHNSVMASGISHAFITKGYSPQDFVLCAGGAAGGLCALRIADELNMKRVIIPKYAPVYSSMGMLGVDVRHDFSRHYSSLATDLDLNEIKRFYKEMEGEGNRLLASDGLPQNQRALIRTVRMRYYGQFRDLEVRWPSGAITKKAIAEGITNFHRHHKELFGSCNEEYPLEIMKFGLTAIGKMPRASIKKIKRGTKDASYALIGERKAYFEESGDYTPTKIYNGDKLLAGNCLEGPCIVEEKMTTIVVPPGFSLRVDEGGNYFTT